MPVNMTDELFDACLEKKKMSTKNSQTPIWVELVDEYNLDVTPEALRSAFKRAFRNRELDELEAFVPTQMPRVAVIDIEVLPMRFEGFGLYDQNFGVSQIIEELAFLSWSGKYLNEPEIYHDVLTPDEALSRDDYRVTSNFFDFLYSCEIVIGHNWIGYDGKMVNNFGIIHGFLPHKYKVVDTLQIARSNFRFPTNKLEYINQYLGISRKVDNEGFPLWRKCGQGDPASLEKMLLYNDGDILATEDLYHKFKPYVRGINAALWSEIEEPVCPVPGCGGVRFENYGYYNTTSSKFKSVRCEKCGSVSRLKTNLLSKRKRSVGLTLI